MSVWLLLNTFCAVVHAYVPSSSYVLRQWALKQYQAPSLQIRSRVLSFDAREGMGKEPQQAQYSLFERLSFKDGRYLSSLEQKGGVKVSSKSQSVQQGSLWMQILFVTDSKRLRSQLIRKGLGLLTDDALQRFNTDQERNQAEPQMLGRYLGEVFWVLGKKRIDSAGPELWIQRDQFLPRRWILGPAHEPQFEIWVSGWQVQSQFAAPQQMWIRSKESSLGWYVKLEKLDLQAKLPTSLVASSLSEGVDEGLKEWTRSFYEWVR